MILIVVLAIKVLFYLKNKHFWVIEGVNSTGEFYLTTLRRLFLRIKKHNVRVESPNEQA